MTSEIVINRLRSIIGILNTAHGGGKDMASSTIGREREAFIDLVLRNVIGPPFRIGSGEAVDQNNNSSGQIDIAIEYSNSLSFPLLFGTSERLYLAESVCAAIEVKSNLSAQWDEVVSKAAMISKLTRDPGAVAWTGNQPWNRIPTFAVGFKGWATAGAVRRNLDEVNASSGRVLAGVLQIDPPMYLAHPEFKDHEFEDERALFGLLLSLEELTSTMLGAKPAFKPYVT